ncbi:hypothetical protein H7X87_03595 [Acetobacteraceae bacterium]|nr:hypothetical protein [Candidatus Parcubacteria bacterium]
MKKIQYKRGESLPVGRRGFTIFFAVLVASLSLSVGLAIYDLLVRELVLSQTVRESQYAIYAADTGIECALYWDSKAPVLNGATSVFGTSSTAGAAGWGSSASPFCTGQNISTLWGSVPPPGSDANHATTTFTMYITAAGANGPCVRVEIGKYSVPTLRTSVEAHGYNTCATGGFKVERALQANY